MEHLLRALLTGLLQKIWPHRPDPYRPIEEILQEERRYLRMYRWQLLLFFVNWGVVAWLLGGVFRWLYRSTLQLPADVLAYLPTDNWQFYVTAFLFGLGLAGPLSNVLIRAATDDDGYKRFQQYVQWKNKLDNRAAIPLIALFLLIALTAMWFMLITPLVLTKEKIMLRDTWLPKSHEILLTDIRSIDHYEGFLNRKGELRHSPYYELVLADGQAMKFGESDGFTSETELTRKQQIVDALQQLTGLKIREMGVATPFE